MCIISLSSSLSLCPSLFQTKEALFTILRDLRPGDHFNFVSFSNRIKVWKPKSLVPVTPLNVRDAKKFIYMLTPTGGEGLFSLMLSRPVCLLHLIYLQLLFTIFVIFSGRELVGSLSISINSTFCILCEEHFKDAVNTFAIPSLLLHQAQILTAPCRRAPRC